MWREPEGSLFPPGILLAGARRPLECSAAPPSARGRAPAPAWVPRGSPLGPHSGPHSDATDVAQGRLRIAVRAHISFLLSPQNLIWGVWSSVKHALGTSPTRGEWQKEPGQAELILQPVLNRGLLDLGHQHQSHPWQGTRYLPLLDRSQE